MSLLPLIVAFLVFVALLTLIMYLVGRWMSAYVQRSISARLDALDQIVNDERVPEEWLKPYRARAAKLVRAGARPQQLAALNQTARKRCLTNIAELIRYVEQVGLSDTPDTKQFMLVNLREQEARWKDDAVWADLVDLTQPPPPKSQEADA